MLFNSTGVDSQRLLPASLEDQIVGLMGRVLGFGMLAVLALVWTSVLSWSVTDPSLTHATGGETRNLLGPLGAIVSDLLLQTFGYAATIALLPPMLWGLELAVAERVQGFRAKIAFFPLAVLMLAGAFSSLPTFAGWPLHHGYGGLLGDAVLRLATSVLAVVNPDRAGIAAGLVLLAAGLSAISYSIGVELREIWSLTRGVPRSLRLGSWRGAFGDRTTLPSDSRYLAGSDASMQPQGYPPMAGPPTYVSIGEHGGHPGWHGGYPAPQPTTYVISPTLQNPYAEYEEPAAGYMPAAEAGRPVASWTPPRSGAHAPYPVHEPARGHVGMAASAAEPMHGSSDGPDVVRDMEFDLATDDSSRWIAERFAPGAPAGAPEPRVPHPAVGRGTPTQPQPPMPQGPIPSSSPPPQPSPQAQAQPPSQPAARPAPGRARSGLIGGIGFRKPAPTTKRPSLNLLKRPTAARPGPELTQTVLRGNARLLEDVLADFGIKGEVRDIRPGPVVTLYEVEPARGTKSSRVISLADDIARSMSAAAVRVAVVPGRNAIGIELPNARRESVLLRDILESEAFRTSQAALPIALGKSIGGEPVVADLARMPHLLVAGTTGSGKSVGVNAMILSLIFRHSPEDCRFLMIDPKMLELSVYNGIPHLLAPVVTDPQKAVNALNWAVGEMEERYKRMAKLGVRNIDVFNNRVRNAKKRGEMIARTVQTGFDRRTGEAVYEQESMALEPLPYIVVVIDELADLMVVAGKDIEAALQRLAQMARAAGIHLVMATQRPSVDVITGTIKANFPTRISFKVASKIDSRTILGEQGAEQLLGAGDMLLAAGAGQPTRVHGPFVADEEVEAISQFLRQQGEPRYIDGLADRIEPDETPDGPEARGASEEDLYDRAVAVVLRDRKASTSYIQRRLAIGYNRAADLIERMEREGLISPANSVGKREILAGSGSGGGGA